MQRADQAAEHRTHSLHLRCNLAVLRVRQESQFQSKKGIILKFVERTQRVEQESPEVGIRPSARSLCDIRRNRNRRALKLVTKRPRLWLPEHRGHCVRRERQFVRMLPHSQISVVLHAEILPWLPRGARPML